jgi:hypothetical protein
LSNKYILVELNLCNFFKGVSQQLKPFNMTFWLLVAAFLVLVKDLSRTYGGTSIWHSCSLEIVKIELSFTDSPFETTQFKGSKRMDLPSL